ncbi:MAG TPA: alkaline phosphatase D family protein [Usitatibacteraceae bacterium]|nr:alkaline phosphatase D family protein [Usitatibacteraceae bacterium]
MTVRRRAFLRHAFALAAAGFLAPVASRAQARTRFSAYPFSLGVASGSPSASGIVLWTRLAPEPLAGGGMGPEAVEVRWEIAHDERFSRIAKRGIATAEASRAHAVHVEAEGLDPARWYHYRFLAGGEASATGRTRTAPGPGAGDERLKLALASCQHFEQGHFVAHRHLSAEAPDLVAFVGDYIYESSWGRDHVRKHHTGEPKDLAGYRDRYGQYKSDRDLQAAHACAPWLVTWDDHEVDNDYARDRAEDLDPDFLARRAAGYRAYLEHLPLRPGVLRPDGEMRLYGAHAWGALANLFVLDDRQYRDPQACPKSSRGGGNVVGPWCTQRSEEGRTMLGARQERWLDQGLANSKARWNLIVQQTLMAPAGRENAKGRQHWTDGWDGYPRARERLVASLAGSGAANPVVLGGDVHASFVANLHARPDDPSSPVVAAEFCGTSISAQGPDAKRVAAILDANPSIRHGDGSRRGYTILEFGRDRLETRLRTVETVKHADAGVSTAAVFAVTAGRAGLER